MIEKIKIENYKNFKSFEFDGFKRVNLIAGKNNTGKTNLLEALYLAENHLKPGAFLFIFLGRDGLSYSGNLGSDSVFFNQNFESGIREVFRTDSKSGAMGFTITLNDKLEFKAHYYNFELGSGSNASTVNPVILYSQKYNENSPNRLVRFSGPELTYDKFFDLNQGNINYIGGLVKPSFIMAGFHEVINFGSIIGEAKELNRFDLLLKSLGNLLGNEGIEIEDIFMKDHLKTAITKVRFKDSDRSVKLSELGFGSNRIVLILSFILSHPKNSIIYIDEIDIGVHYSLQEKFWDVIYFLSKQLEIQIFATTHSRDCFEAFAKVANQDENIGSGKFIRLKDNGVTIKAVEYDDEDIASAAESGIEVR